MDNILWALLWFAVLGGVLGVALAVASKLFAIKTDPRIPEIIDLLPGANCGGCGHSGCAALAEAITRGEASPAACNAASDESIEKISALMGIAPQKAVRMRAQVMCSGTRDVAKNKYRYNGVKDCYAASRLDGGFKYCINGCLGMGSCVLACKFDAISVENGVARVDPEKCRACGMCTNACPQHIIRLVPFDSTIWVACMSAEKGPVTRSYCEVGCIACKICEKNCPTGAIKVENFRASIDYEKCTHCGVCVTKCPRKIIKVRS